MTGINRISQTGQVNREKTLNFTFNGKPYQGLEGDSLASALLANDVHLVGRSFKYHRPRGFLAAGPEEPNGMVQLETGSRTEPNIRATEIELYDGLEASSVNVWPSVDFDVSAINGLFSKIFVAGFYYKTFMAPQSLWMKLYEPLIRKAAGWGKAPSAPDPDFYDQMHLHVDVMIVGSGPAGLSAALAAGQAGARVLLVDEKEHPGGSLLSQKRLIDGENALDTVDSMMLQLAEMPEVRILSRATAFGYYDQNYLCVLEHRTDHLGPVNEPKISRQRVWHIRAKEVVLATGAHERPLVFADNDRPGIMLAGSVQSYVNRYGVLPGKKAVLFTNNDAAYETALDILDAGGAVAAIVDIRGSVDGDLIERAKDANIEIITGHAISATRGRKRIISVDIQAFDAGAKICKGEKRRIDCDLLAMSGGWSPVVHLYSQSQGKLVYNEEKACFVPGKPVQRQHFAGAVTGRFKLIEALADGYGAGVTAAAAAGFRTDSFPAAPTVTEPAADKMTPCWLVPSDRPLGEGSAKHFVDLQNDSTAADIYLAAREGFESVEHVKRYTLTGFGTDQGKTSNINAIGILAGVLDRPLPDVGTTTQEKIA